MPVLYCRHLDKRTQWKVATGDSFTIGFSSAASVPIPDRNLAPREVGVSRSGDRYVLRDLAERGRVLLNGLATREGLLEDGDRVQVGRISILFLDDARVGGGEVDLYPRETGPDADARRWELLEAEGDHAPPVVRSHAVEQRRSTFILCVAISLIVGLAIGVVVIRPPRAPSRPPQTGGTTAESTPKNASPGSAGPVKRIAAGGAGSPAVDERPSAKDPAPPSHPTAPPDGDAAGGARPEEKGARTLDEIRRLTGEGDEPAGTPAPETGEPAKTSARTEPAAADAASPSAPAPAIVRREAISAAEAASRFALFRLFLDIARRPPTRQEERTMLRLPHEERFRRVMETARREGSPEPPLSIEPIFQLWIGRPPSPQEVREIAAASSPERPPALTISSRPDYASPERRRPRSMRQQARSLIVDLLDRPPSSEAEVALVESALRQPRTLDELARTLVHSPESRLGEDPADSWESEFFRFFLRAPGPAERREIERAIEGLPAKAAARYLALALVSFPEYRSY
jgi:hypothetical protein